MRSPLLRRIVWAIIGLSALLRLVTLQPAHAGTPPAPPAAHIAAP